MSKRWKAVVLATALAVMTVPLANHAEAGGVAWGTATYTVVKQGASENVCYTARPLASHHTYSGTATVTFTTAESLSTTASSTLGLPLDKLTAQIGLSVTSQLTKGFSVTVGPIAAGKTGVVYSRAIRTQYAIKKYGPSGQLLSQTTGVAVQPVRGQFCSFIYNY